ncbi:hypothetical protein PCE1_004297 [Barthelona sp. PCE]
MAARKIVIYSLILVALVLIYFIVALEICGLGLYCFKYNSLSGTISPEDGIYEAGNHFVGFFVSFISFPSTLKTIQLDRLSTTALSGDTINTVFLDVSFQYRYNKNTIGDMYKIHKEGYASVIAGEAQTIVKSVSNTFEIPQFFNNRTGVGQVMLQELQEHFANPGYIEILYFQLRDVDIESSFEDQIVATQVAAQVAEKRLYELQVAAIEAETREKYANATAEIQVIQAEANAESLKITREAEATAIETVNLARVEAFNDLKDRLNFTSTEMVDFLELEMIRKHKTAQVFAGENVPVMYNI